ncbi:MAG: bacterial Ig-like domain-containing protein, partial [Alistipes sp.]|nr:bacterial Ig-like domain-containing protein [Alistipes sp.]
ALDNDPGQTKVDELTQALQDAMTALTDKSVASVAVTTAPTKTTYHQDKETLDITGGKVTVYYDNNTSKVIDLTIDMVSGFDNTKAGSLTLTVTVEDKTTTFDITVADGGVNGGANIFPELYVAMFDAAEAGDLKRVRELQRRIMQISGTIYTVGKYGSSYLKGVKCALSLLGICDDYLSWPYRKFRTEEREKIRKALADLGAL